MKTIILMGVVFLCAVQSSVMAGTKTFTGGLGGTGTNWHTNSNWDLGVPTLADDAVIASGKTAVISDDDAVCKLLYINSTATVRIESRTLTVDSPFEDADFLGDVFVNGTLQFKKTGSAVPRLDHNNEEFTISGSGTIDASAGSGLGPGIITYASGWGGLMTFYGDPNHKDSPLLVKGSLQIDPLTSVWLSDVNPDLDGCAVFLVDNANDVMMFGKQDSGSLQGRILGRSGDEVPGATITITAGQVHIGRLKFDWTGSNDEYAWFGTINVEGGAFEVENLGAGNENKGAGAININGGSFVTYLDWTNYETFGNHLSLTHGNISVKSGHMASFE